MQKRKSICPYPNKASGGYNYFPVVLCRKCQLWQPRRWANCTKTSFKWWPCRLDLSSNNSVTLLWLMYVTHHFIQGKILCHIIWKFPTVSMATLHVQECEEWQTDKSKSMNTAPPPSKQDEDQHKYVYWN